MAFVYQSNDHKQQEIRGHFRELTVILNLLPQ